MLKMPSYIEKSGIVGAPIEYKWKSHLHMNLADKVPNNIQAVVQSISCKATFSLSLAIAEWAVWRLQGISEHVSETCAYLEALWASSIDYHYLKIQIPIQPKDQSDPGTGPLYGIEAKVFRAVTNARLDHPERAKTSAALVSIVKYILPSSDKFDEWLKTILGKFTSQFPMEKDDPQGVIIPRKFCDPDFTLDKHMIPQVLDEQLQVIDHVNNQFLASPAQMKASGFAGEPYRFTR